MTSGSSGSSGIIDDKTEKRDILQPSPFVWKMDPLGNFPFYRMNRIKQTYHLPNRNIMMCKMFNDKLQNCWQKKLMENRRLVNIDLHF